MKKVVTLNESDLSQIITNVLSEQEKMERRINTSQITAFNLLRWADKGLKPYQYVIKNNRPTLVEITKKTSTDFGGSRISTVYLLNEKDMEVLNKLIVNITEIIDLKEQAIKAFLQYVPSVIEHKLL